MNYIFNQLTYMAQNKMLNLHISQEMQLYHCLKMLEIMIFINVLYNHKYNMVQDKNKKMILQMNI